MNCLPLTYVNPIPNKISLAKKKIPYKFTFHNLLTFKRQMELQAEVLPKMAAKTACISLTST